MSINGKFSETLPRLARVASSLISNGFLSNSDSSRISKHWGSYACSLCFNVFSFVKGYPSLDSNAEAQSFMRAIRSKL